MSTVITAGNATNGLSLSADNAGAFEFKTGTGAGTTAITISSTQTVSIPKGVGGTPAFSAYKNAAQTLSSATFTKITFNTEEFDTNNNFASSTFTPTVAGYYQINGQVSNGTGTQTVASIYKNGTVYKDGNNAASFGAIVSAIVYFNGSTDYVELYGYFALGTTTGSGISSTWFNGSLVRGA
jgi:hypothetical protein